MWWKQKKLKTWNIFFQAAHTVWAQPWFHEYRWTFLDLGNFLWSNL